MAGVPKATGSAVPQAHGSDEGGLELGLGDALGPAPGVRSEQGGARKHYGSALGDVWAVAMAQILNLGALTPSLGRVNLCLGDVSDGGWRRRARCQGHARVVAHEVSVNGR